ncbi:MAG: SIS domain-containing protein [Steroidobacteraceae bacterium]
MSFVTEHLAESRQIIDQLDIAAIEKMADLLAAVRERGGRLFVMGVGGGAGHAGHAVNDFRKLAGIESYSPSDNVSELTARANDEGWDTTYAGWLRVSRICANDAVFVFSVGGGDAERNISANLVRAVELAKQVGATIMGVVGRDGGYTAKHADAVSIIPTVNPAQITPHTEAFQAVVWHLLVSHPKVMKNTNKWESSQRP